VNLIVKRYKGGSILYKHIIWDFDGTLFNSYPLYTEALKNSLELQGIKDSYENILTFLMVSESHAMDYYVTNYHLDRQLLKTKYDGYRKEAKIDIIKPFPNVIEICKDIYLSNKKNYLYTNKGESSTDVLKHYNIFEYFCDFITREKGFKRKPDPEALLYLADKHTIIKKQAIMIGDRDIDILSAKNAGIKSCFIDPTGLQNCEYADYYIQSIKQLKDIIF